MSGTTPEGFPYPDPTDPVTDGADAIRALAESLAGRTTTALAPNSKVPGDLYSTYPMGISTVTLNNAAGVAWPSGTTSSVVTFRTAADRAAQWVFLNSATITAAYYRQGNSNGWSPWRNAAGPYAKANGTTIIAISNATSRVLVVTLPAGRFTTDDYQGFANIKNGDAPASNWHARVISKTLTTFSLFCWQATAVASSPSLNVDWTVEQQDA